MKLHNYMLMKWLYFIEFVNLCQKVNREAWRAAVCGVAESDMTLLC